MCSMAFGGMSKSCFSKRMYPMSICFGKTGDVYFATANTVTDVL